MVTRCRNRRCCMFRPRESDGWQGVESSSLADRTIVATPAALRLHLRASISLWDRVPHRKLVISEFLSLGCREFVPMRLVEGPIVHCTVVSTVGSVPCPWNSSVRLRSFSTG